MVTNPGSKYQEYFSPASIIFFDFVEVPASSVLTFVRFYDAFGPLFTPFVIPVATLGRSVRPKIAFGTVEWGCRLWRKPIGAGAQRRRCAIGSVRLAFFP